MLRARPYRLLLPSLLLLALGACADRGPTLVAPGGPALDLFGGHIRWVAHTGSDVGDCTVSPCRTINYAIGQASVGDSVSVGPGTYRETVIVMKRLSLVGHDAVVDATGQTAQPNGFFISGPGAEGSSVSGFFIENAGLEGIFVLHTARITIQNNVLVNNDAYGPLNPLCAAQPADCGEALHLQSVVNSMVRNNIVRNNIGGILLTDENGPTYGNTITGNMVLNNTKDCGITLASHYFSLTAVATPSVGGVYRNTVTNNTSNGNGAAGIGVFAGPPGAAAWSNVVSGNTAMNNGEGGIMIHSHTPLQNVNNNVVTNNTLSGNGIDPDNPNDDAPTGISIFSAVIPIPFTVVSLNQISNEHYGINSTNAVTLSGLNTNVFAASVAVPTSIH